MYGAGIILDNAVLFQPLVIFAVHHPLLPLALNRHHDGELLDLDSSKSEEEESEVALSCPILRQSCSLASGRDSRLDSPPPP